MKLEIRKSRDKQYYWVVRSNNSKIFCTSEMYTRKNSAVRAAKSFAKNLIKSELLVGEML